MQMNNIVEQIRSFVEEECKKPSSKYGYEPFVNHFIPMHDFAVKLAEEQNADLEIVELAAWLHDIGSIVYGRENHHITSAKIAEEKLREWGYPEKKIEIVKKCILNHRGSCPGIKESKEEQIIADADAMSAFEHIEGLFRAAYVSENMNQEEARKSVLEKFENCWNKISKEAREIVKNKYEAVMMLLK
jgi:uncharacterized protein